MEMKRILAVGVILLFIGVSVAPTINFQVVKASTDNDLVKVTTQACGIQGYEDTTVKLTRKQYQDLEQYLVDFRERLNQTSTREEAIPIFKEAVVELDKYGLLPRGMSVEKAQKLVIARYKSFQDRYILNSLMTNSKLLDDNRNTLCYFTGQIDNSFVWTLRARLLTIPLVLFEVLIMSFHDILPKLTEFIDNLLVYLYFNVLSISPIGFNEWISIGVFSGYWPYSIYYPSNGWIHTIGMNGIKKWEGSIAGGWLSPPVGQPRFGAFDFTGLALYLDNNERFYLGFALSVNLYNY
jgi:hypothetical protein